MSNRNQSLDVLRGIAILLVLLCHYPYVHWMGAGWIGVDLFFVLSGFLISGLLFTEIKRKGSISIGRFLARRGFKIYPSFYVFIGLTAVLIPVLRPHFLVHALFLQSYYPADMSVWVHTWSLAVEEHFYLMLPFLIALLLWAKRLHWLPWLAIPLLVVCFFLRAENHGPHLWASHLRMDALFAGVALGYLFHFKPERFAALSRWYLPLLAAPFLVAPFLGPETNYAISATMTTNLIGFSLILIWIVPRQIPGCAWFAKVGVYSYSIYVWHQVVARLWQPLKHLSFLGLCGYLTSSILLGIVMSKAVEFPVLKLRDRLFPSTSRQQRVQADLRVIAIPSVHKGESPAASAAWGAHGDREILSAHVAE